MRVRHLVAVPALLVAAALALVPVAAPAQAAGVPAPGGVVDGGDVSWPNCPKGTGIASRHGLGLPMPVPSARFVVVGATNGPAFTTNPCLGSQVAWARRSHLRVSAYSVVSYPTAAQLARYGGKGTLDRRLHRVGVAQAQQTLRTLRGAGLGTPMVWVDVETVHGLPWSTVVARNNALLAGVLAGYRAAHVRTGIYSYAYAWKKITGGKRSVLPTWVPSGSNQRVKALARCSRQSFSGGPVVMGQWSDGKRDYNLTCPGTARRLPALFAVA